MTKEEKQAVITALILGPKFDEFLKELDYIKHLFPTFSTMEFWEVMKEKFYMDYYIGEDEKPNLDIPIVIKKMIAYEQRTEHVKPTNP